MLRQEEEVDEAGALHLHFNIKTLHVHRASVRVPYILLGVGGWFFGLESSAQNARDAQL
jgi:hypothetical protein